MPVLLKMLSLEPKNPAMITLMPIQALWAYLVSWKVRLLNPVLQA